MWGRIITATFQNWRVKLSATGYLLSQEALIAGLEVAPEEFSHGAYGTYKVPYRRIEGLTRALARRAALRRSSRDRAADLVL